MIEFNNGEVGVIESSENINITGYGYILPTKFLFTFALIILRMSAPVCVTLAEKASPEVSPSRT